MFNFIVQLIGIFGVFLCLICYHGKTRKTVLKIKLFADMFWGIHYMLLGAYAGLTMNILCGIREFVYLFDENEKRRVAWLVLFMTVNWIVAFLTWNGISSIMPAFATTIATYSFWQKNIKTTRIIALCISSVMFIYDVLFHSYAGIVNEVLTFVSTGIALYTNRKNTITSKN